MIKNRLIVYFIIVLLIGVIILFLLKPKKDELDLEKNMNSSLKSIGPLCSVDNCVGKAGIVKGVEGNGFKFNNYTSRAFFNKIKEALKVYENRDAWRELVTRGMALDFSWENSATRYMELYEKALSKRR